MKADIMKKLREMLAGAAALLAGALFITSTALAGAGDFSGPYISVTAQASGAQLSGTHTDEDGAVTGGSAGKVFPVAGAEIGINIPITDRFFVTVGASMNPSSVNISDADDGAGTADTKISIRDNETVFIQPSFAISESSAFYFKLGSSDADMKTENVESPPSSLSGDLYAVGSTSLFPNGLFVRTEAGIHLFDNLSFTGVGGSASATLEAEPQMAYGALTLGYKF